ERPLVEQIKQLQAQRDQLEAQLGELLKRHTTTEHELVAVKTQLEQLNNQYNKALDEVTRLRAQNSSQKTLASKLPLAVTNVQIAWNTPGIVNTSGRVVGRHEASSRSVDMQ